MELSNKPSLIAASQIGQQLRFVRGQQVSTDFSSTITSPSTSKSKSKRARICKSLYQEHLGLRSHAHPSQQPKLIATRAC